MLLTLPKLTLHLLCRVFEWTNSRCAWVKHQNASPHGRPNIKGTSAQLKRVVEQTALESTPPPPHRKLFRCSEKFRERHLMKLSNVWCHFSWTRKSTKALWFLLFRLEDAESNFSSRLGRFRDCQLEVEQLIREVWNV